MMNRYVTFATDLSFFKNPEQTNFCDKQGNSSPLLFKLHFFVGEPPEAESTEG